MHRYIHDYFGAEDQNSYFLCIKCLRMLRSNLTFEQTRNRHTWIRACNRNCKKKTLKRNRPPWLIIYEFLLLFYICFFATVRVYHWFTIKSSTLSKLFCNLSFSAFRGIIFTSLVTKNVLTITNMCVLVQSVFALKINS